MPDVKIVSSEDVLGGEPRIEGTRVGVSHAVQYYEMDWNVEKISRELNLEPLQVIKALEYYYQHPEEVRGIIRDRESKNNSISGETLEAGKA